AGILPRITVQPTDQSVVIEGLKQTHSIRGRISRKQAVHTLQQVGSTRLQNGGNPLLYYGRNEAKQQVHNRHANRNIQNRAAEHIRISAGKLTGCATLTRTIVAKEERSFLRPRGAEDSLAEG